ncbi:MAG: D-alanine--D-alanine ligase [Phycisphaerales bacterium]|nr:MAG: D-alanine--D-alanine ligase [Phycisphaerales bacterium]
MNRNRVGRDLKPGKSKLKIAVLAGGIGAERQISIQSGRCVAEALKQAGFDIVTSDIRPDYLDILDDESIDVFFPALHGEFGEDGQLQRILETRSLLFTGSGSASSELAFDKIASKKLFDDAGVTTPAAVEFSSETDLRSLEERLRDFAGSYVVKPVKQGSSVGISIVSTADEAITAATETLSEFGDCMIEEFIAGREVTVGILDGRALPIIEVQPGSGFYDYDAKYVDDRTEYLFDTITEPAVVAGVNKAAIDCFEALGCRHFARVDFILRDDRIAYVLEANTIPGFTSHSLLPKAAAKAGLSMSDLCSIIVEAAQSTLAGRRA